LQTLPAAASLFEALLFFLEHGVRHAAIEDGGRIVAMLTDTDLLRLAGRSPLAVFRKIERLAAPAGEPGGGEPIAAAAAPGGLAGYAREIAGMVAAQAAAGVEAVEVGRIVARLNDALVRRLLVLAEEALGPPPCPYAWLVLGSEGRMEQALLTDQDNALVYEREEAPAPAYFAALAGRVTADLLAAGFPPCPGGYMATRWCRPLAGWVELFRGYIATPQAEALLGAAIFFDFRAAAGRLALAPLEDQVRAGGREGIFLAQLARAALRFAPPLGPLHRLREEEGAVDLKRSGIAPIVALARLYALEAGGSARPTLERLAEAVRGGTLSRDGAATLGEAFRFLLRLRLRRQLEALAAGEELDNRVRLAALSPLERVHLKDVFVALRELQQATALRYSTERLG
jgi:CBS domain-containing protein